MVNDRSLLVRFSMQWNAINHVVDSLGSKMNRMPWADAVAGPAGLARAGFLLFLWKRDETNCLSVWSCPSFQFIRMRKMSNPSFIVSLMTVSCYIKSQLNGKGRAKVPTRKKKGAITSLVISFCCCDKTFWLKATSGKGGMGFFSLYFQGKNLSLREAEPMNECCLLACWLVYA